jgi:hypothetical protein
MNKLSPAINFKFNEQEDFPIVDLNIDIKTNTKTSDIKIKKNKRNKRDGSTGLF